MWLNGEKERRIFQIEKKQLFGYKIRASRYREKQEMFEME